MDDVLVIDDVSISYRERDRTVRAADGVHLRIAEGETLALVGESGCGKTTLALAGLNLVPHPGVIDSGRVLFRGEDLLTMKPEPLRKIRGNEISMIFQDPVSGLNPVLTIGSQVEEMVRTHMSASKQESRRMTAEALRRQGMFDAERIMGAYPFQLSGGMCQRVMIAIATMLRPSVIIADEPTSALDVTVQAGILSELDDLKKNLGVGILLITHDLGVVARMADRVAVMYAGRIVEQASVADIYARPTHPYTAALLAARPTLTGDRRPLRPIRGTPPDLSELTGECAFLLRCPKAVNACRTQPWPPLAAIVSGHETACYNPMFHAD